jgi:hypothetical protein
MKKRRTWMATLMKKILKFIIVSGQLLTPEDEKE